MIGKHNVYTEGVLLAVAPAVGYWVAFVYELGYFGFYDVPNSFIEVSLNTILINTMIVSGVLVFYFFLISMLSKAMRSFPVEIRWSLYKIIGVVSVLFAWAAIFEPPSILVNLFFIVFVIPVILWEFCWPVWKFRRIKGYLNKVNAHRRQQDKEEVYLDKIADKLGVLPMSLLIFVYLASTFAFFIGAHQARNQVTYLVSEQEPNYVILRKYEKEWLALKINVEQKTFERTYKIISPKNATTLTQIDLGPLTLIKPSAVRADKD